MDSLFLKVIAVPYLGLGVLGVLAMCRPGFRSYALAGLVRFPVAAKLTWTVLFSASASLFGLSLLVMPEISPWLGGATAITYLASSLHEVWVDYGARGHRLLRRGFFMLAAVHIGVTILVTFSVLHLHAGSGEQFIQAEAASRLGLIQALGPGKAGLRSGAKSWAAALPSRPGR